MARSTVTFDSFNLQDTTYKTREIQHESMDSRELKIQRLGRRDGGKLVSETFGVKRIILRGTITGTDIDDLEQNIDTMKEALNRQERNLDIEYASDTRRYKCSCTQIKIGRSHFHLTFVPFEAEFAVSNQAFGHALDTSTIDFRSISVTGTGTWEGNGTFTGTRRPMPTIVMRVNSEDMFEWVAFRNVNTNGQIRVDQSFNAGDNLTINTDDYTVTLNGTAVGYSGFFPEFVQGGNDFAISFGATSANFDIYLIYYPLYL